MFCRWYCICKTLIVCKEDGYVLRNYNKEKASYIYWTLNLLLICSQTGSCRKAALGDESLPVRHMNVCLCVTSVCTCGRYKHACSHMLLFLSRAPCAVEQLKCSSFLTFFWSKRLNPNTLFLLLLDNGQSSLFPGRQGIKGYFYFFLFFVFLAYTTYISFPFFKTLALWLLLLCLIKHTFISDKTIPPE